MKILYFSKDYTTHDHRFLTALAGRDGDEIFYLRLNSGGRQFEDRALPGNVTVLHWDSEKRTPRALKRILKAVQPDVVHAGPLQEVAWLVAKAGFAPLVSMSWGSDLLVRAEESKAMRRKTQFVFEHSAGFVGDCEAVRQKALEFGFEAEKMVIFPWGIDLQRFVPKEDDALKSRWGWGEDEFVIYHSRSWEPIYGVGAMAKGFVMAARQRPELRLMMLGGGSMVQRLRGILQQGGVMDKVHFTGQVSQTALPDYYHQADLYVSASLSDGSSVSLMEAMGSGLPVLVSDIPGNREWVTDENGWLFGVNDVTAIAEGMVQAVDAREELAAMGMASRKMAEAKANWEENFTLLWEAFERIVKA